jgi:NAD(P)-dependent dehydrogenase (short-subunit alcohol dehydrogenase family)
MTIPIIENTAARTLEGHVSVITGGNGGIGLGIAQGLASAGAQIAIWGRNREKTVDAAESMRNVGFRVHYEVCDVSDEDQVHTAFQSTLASCGKIDSVIANAGIPSKPQLPWDISLEEWRRIHAVNLDGTFLTLREGSRYFVDRGSGGSMIVVSSTSAIHGAPATAAYATSKTAVLGLMRSFAVALGRHKVRVNALLPGWTDTDMLAPGKSHQRFVEATVSRTPVRRWADPSDYAGAAIYLADPRWSFHTGDALVVDGGYTIF